MVVVRRQREEPRIGKTPYDDELIARIDLIEELPISVVQIRLGVALRRQRDGVARVLEIGKKVACRELIAAELRGQVRAVDRLCNASRQSNDYN